MSVPPQGDEGEEAPAWLRTARELRTRPSSLHTWKNVELKQPQTCSHMVDDSRKHPDAELHSPELVRAVKMSVLISGRLLMLVEAAGRWPSSLKRSL